MRRFGVAAAVAPVLGAIGIVGAGVPFGEDEVWIGASAELAAGKPSRRRTLTVDAKGVPFLEIPVR